MAVANPLDEFLTWLTPRQAEDELEGLGGWITIRSAILERLKSDLITARAETRHRTQHGEDQREEFPSIPGAVWKEYAPSVDSDFWETAQFSFLTGGGYSNSEHRYFGVRFSPDGIARLKIASGIATFPRASPIEGERPPTNKGGRPPSAYWEPLLIEMTRQLYSGDLQPKRQADIEKAMHDWLIAQGERPSETQVRKRAKSLWEAIGKEVRN